MNKGQLRGLVVGVILELDEIIKGEGERTAGKHELLKCRELLSDLADRLKPSRSGETVNGSELLDVFGQFVGSLLQWLGTR